MDSHQTPFSVHQRSLEHSKPGTKHNYQKTCTYIACFVQGTYAKTLIGIISFDPCTTQHYLYFTMRKLSLRKAK